MNFTNTNRVSFYKMYLRIDEQEKKHVNKQVEDQVCGEIYWLISVQIIPTKRKIKREINK